MRTPSSYLAIVLFSFLPLTGCGLLAGSSPPGDNSPGDSEDRHPDRRRSDAGAESDSDATARARSGLPELRPGRAPVGSLDWRLRWRLKLRDVSLPEEPGPFDPERVELGRNLFFDKALSGNEDVACSTCHHPRAVTGDGLALAVGVDGHGEIPNRRRTQNRPFVPRNSPELFVRGPGSWETMFWDARVEEKPNGELSTPAGDKLQSGLTGVVAAQAMFPVTSRVEMRGFESDDNPISSIPDGALTEMWSKLMDRLLGFDGYREMFRDAYPQKSLDELKFRDAANAIAAFEKSAFHYLDSPFDRYLRGDDDALTPRQKRGAILFYGKAGCASCHSGNLMTDQEFHNIGAPQIGPGKGEHEPLDPGRFLVDPKRKNKYAFRTPPLRNVAVTGPYLHSGAYESLRAVAAHHLRPKKSLRNYSGKSLRPAVRAELHDSEEVVDEVLRHLDLLPRLRSRIQQNERHPLHVSDREVDRLVAFLKSLTSPSLDNLDAAVTPESVPSGLPVD